MVVAGVVGADGFAAAAAEEAPYRLSRQLTGEVPQGDVDGRDRPHLRAGPAGVGDGDEHVLPQPLDVARVLADQQRRQVLLDDGALALTARIRLAEADDALIGVDADPQPA